MMAIDLCCVIGLSLTSCLQAGKQGENKSVEAANLAQAQKSAAAQSS